MPAFKLAEEARDAERHGDFCRALKLFHQAIGLWKPEMAPEGDDGQPECYWPELWTGSAMTLEHVVALHKKWAADRIRPLVQIVVAALALVLLWG
jgi:hypothetical protein